MYENSVRRLADAGSRGWHEKDAGKFLMTGIAYNDLPARPPPRHRMDKEDAEAIGTT